MEDTINQPIILPLLLERREKILYDIYRQAKLVKEPNQFQLCEIDIGYENNKQRIKEFKDILIKLKKEKIITNYSLNKLSEQKYNWDNKSIITFKVIAKCKIHPNNFIKTLKSNWKQKKDLSDKLAKHYYTLIRTIGAYFENDENPDENLNKLYEALCGEIKKLVNSDYLSSPRLKFLYEKPFSYLFAANKELRHNRITLKQKKDSLNAFYGYILKVRDMYDINTKEENLDLEELENYLNFLENRKDNQKESIIKITEMPELKIQGLQEKIIFQKSKNKKIQFQTFPKNLKWEEIYITFLNEQEVIIKARDKTLQSDYEIMGFQDEKRKMPDKQWMLLRLLTARNGELSWDNNNKLSLKKINSIKKQKQLLSEALKAYFQIESDPFWDYKQEKAYKIKINLLPGRDIVATTKTDNEDDDSDIEKFRREQSPEKYQQW